MNNILVGYGYTASYVSKELINTDEKVEAFSRTPKPNNQSFCKLNLGDIILKGLPPQSQAFYLYYFISPPNVGLKDRYLESFLRKTNFQLCKGILYVSSSAVYGDQKGSWVTEDCECYVTTERQQRRLDAEKQIINICKKNKIPSLILRCAGIYGRDRIPIQAARNQTPIMDSSEAPISNLIYVVDLARIITLLVMQNYSGTYNIADGNPKPMGYLQQKVAQALNCQEAPKLPYKQILESASNMKQFFMKSSKKLDIEKVKSVLPKKFQFTKIACAIEQCINQVEGP